MESIQKREQTGVITREGQGEIVLYQPNDSIRLEVRMEDETVWLTQQQMAELFQTTRNNITLHVKNIFKDGELVEEEVRKESLLTATDGKQYNTKIYNLDVRLDIDRHNAQYSPITIQQFNRAHDRFLLIDDEVYHIGTSLKDLGKKWFAFTKMNDLISSEFISKIQQI